MVVIVIAFSSCIRSYKNVSSLVFFILDIELFSTNELLSELLFFYLIFNVE